MSEYYDTEKIRCLNCKHVWILGSDIDIYEELQNEWITQVLIEHEIIHRKWEKEHEN